MVAPLIAAGVRAAGSQLAKKQLAKTAGTQLAKKEGLQIAGRQTVKTAPRKIGGVIDNTQKSGSFSVENKVNNSQINKLDLVGQKINKKEDVKKQETITQKETTIPEIDPELLVEEERPIAEKRSLLKGVDYFLVLLVVIFKDIFDVINEILSFIFDILLVTSPIGILQYIISTVADFTVLMITQGYFIVNKVKISKQKAGVQGLTTLIEMVPFLGLLPINTISFVYLCKKINKERIAEEIEEQKSLDEEWMKRKEEREKKINEIRQVQNSKTVHKQETQQKEIDKNNSNNNAWKDMVDNSNQNITKSNNINK